MTMNVKETATLQDPISLPVDKRCKPVYCIDNGKRWNSAVECAEELGVHHRTVRNVCNGKLNSCKRLRLRYEENVAEVRTMMATEIGNKDEELAKLRAENARLREENSSERKLADQMRAIIAKQEEEQEVARKTEEDRLKAIEETKTALAKANERRERRQRIVKQKDADLQKSVSRLMDTEKKIGELQLKLLELEGITKES